MPGSARKAETKRTFRVVTSALILATLPLFSHAQADEDEICRFAGDDRPNQAEVVYSHRVVLRFELGEGPRSYWLFEPADPKPELAPVIVFFHGWFAVNPAFYGAWIDHLVRSGRTVVFPRYQNDVDTPPREFLPNAIAATRDALGVLEAGAKHVRPDLPRVAFIGHSAGGNLAAQIAAVASDPHSGLPQPKLVAALMPGQVFPSREPNLGRIPASTLLLVAVGEDDLLVGDLRGRQIFVQADAIPRSRKRYLLFRSDRHGFPPLIAEHTAPTGANRRLDTGEGVFRGLQMSLSEVNAMDRAGFWRIADAAIKTAFAGRTFDEAIRDQEGFTHLGFWSDGRKVIAPLISDNLSTIPRVNFPNGIRLIPWDTTPSIEEAARIQTDLRIR
jgi:pimeloyl-ACP methyl ester carboxylesterase